MEGFEWAENNLGVDSPGELQGRGVNVYFAPNISPDQKVVNLADGRVDFFREGEERPQEGFYADYDTLVRYCRQEGLPFSETNGFVSVQPIGFEEAGSPLRQGET